MIFKKNILCILIMSFTFSLNAQLAKEGMSIKDNNYDFFTAQPKANMQDWMKYNSEKFHDHPEFGVLTSNSPEGNVVEDLSKRTAEIRYFVNLDQPNEFFLQKGYYPINYLDSNDFWRAIESSLAPVGNNIYESKYYYEPAGFDLNLKESYIKTRSGKINFNQWSLYSRTGEKIEFLSKPNWSDYSVGKDGVYIKNIFQGIDAEMEIQKGSIKTSFIMHSNEFGNFDELIFRDKFESNGALNISFTETFDENIGLGDVEIKKNGKPVLKMYEGVGYLLTSPTDRVGFMYSINNQEVDVIVPFSWINENIANNSLVIDPLITGVETTAMVNILGSMYNSSCSFTNSCNYDMSVVFPPFATITNATTNFNYRSLGLCSSSDGASRFSSGTCVSPSQSGYFWYCNVSTQGNCNGNQIAIFNDLSSCLPSPSCTSQNIPFRLEFFRKCKGSSGCSNDCIAVFSDWMVTVTGKTIEFNNLTSTINLSKSVICLGESVTSSTQGSFGVPPYTYNWSLFPSGVPSIGSSSSETIVFPQPGLPKLYVTVTDNCNQMVKDSIVVTVGDTIVPEFSTFGPYCKGEQVSLPTTSDNGITGTWTPTLNTNFVGTNIYTFNSSGCSPSVTKEVTVLKVPYGGISQNVQACEGDIILPEITFTGGNTTGPYTYKYLINGDTLQITSAGTEDNATITIPTDTSGVFNIVLLSVSDAVCLNSINLSATVTIYEKPNPDFEASAYTGEPDIDILFQNNSTNTTSIGWYHFKDSLSYWGNQNNFSHIFIESGEHQIILIAENDHCVDSIIKIITILPREATYVLPNVFTPNGDGANDVLDFHFDNVKELDLVILNRWGNVMYQTNNPIDVWNGKHIKTGDECTDGVYFYKFSLIDLSGKEIEEHGFVHLFRN